MIEPGRGRLDPLEPSVANHLVPIEGNFGMPTKYVRREDLFGESVLARVYDLGVRCRSGNLCDVPLLGGITEYDSHAS